jgi:alcohol oxidase
MPIFDGELLEGNPTFAKGSSAVYADTGPADIFAPDIIYSADDDDAIDAYIRNSGESRVMTFHL